MARWAGRSVSKQNKNLYSAQCQKPLMCIMGELFSYVFLAGI